MRSGLILYISVNIDGAFRAHPAADTTADTGLFIDKFRQEKPVRTESVT
jgi:hypothetical protein